MSIIDILTKKAKKIFFILIVVVLSISIGVYGGIFYHKRQLQASAIGYWMTGVNYQKQREYDYALLYLSEAIALKNDDPLFYGSIAEVYEAKQNRVMALEFYKIALKLFKEEKAGPIKYIEKKIILLQSQIKEDENRKTHK
jgi:tetratricopeptide (TPR) repeat protein